MRVLLKAKGSGLYYGGANRFGAELSEALDFTTVPAAARLALTEHLREAQIALRWDSLNYEIPLPVLQEWCALEENHRLQFAAATLPAPPSSLSPQFTA